MKVAVILFAALAAFGQGTVTVGGSSSVQPGKSVNLTLSLANSTGLNTAALEWTLTFPSTWGVTITPGAASIAAAKPVSCSPVTTNGTITCIAAGINSNTFADGLVAAIQVNVPATAAPGPASVSLTNLIGATLAGGLVAVSPGPPISLTVTNPCDLNGDGKIDGVDLSLVTDQIIGNMACSNGDFTGDGKCDVFDALRLITAALGGVCKVGP